MGRSTRRGNQSGRHDKIIVSRQDLELLQVARARYLLEGMVLYDFGSRSAAVSGFQYLANLHYLPTDDGITREVYLYANAAWNFLEQLAVSQRDGTFRMDSTFPDFIVNMILCFARALCMRSFGSMVRSGPIGIRDPMSQVRFPGLPSRYEFKNLFARIALGYESVDPQVHPDFDSKNFRTVRTILKENLLDKYRDYGAGEFTVEQGKLMREELGHECLGKKETWYESDMLADMRWWRDQVQKFGESERETTRKSIKHLIDLERTARAPAPPTSMPALEPAPGPQGDNSYNQNRWVSQPTPMNQGRPESESRAPRSRSRSRSRKRQESGRSTSQGPPPAKRDLRFQDSDSSEFPVRVSSSSTAERGRRQLPPPSQPPSSGQQPLGAVGGPPPGFPPRSRETPGIQTTLSGQVNPNRDQGPLTPLYWESSSGGWPVPSVCLPASMNALTAVTASASAMGSMLSPTIVESMDPSIQTETFTVKLYQSDLNCIRSIVQIYDVGLRKPPFYTEEIAAAQGGALHGDIEGLAKRIQRANDLIRDHADGPLQEVVTEPSISLHGFGLELDPMASQAERTLNDLCRYIAALQNFYYRCNLRAFHRDRAAYNQNRYGWNITWCGMALELLVAAQTAVPKFVERWNPHVVAEWALSGPYYARPSESQESGESRESVQPQESRESRESQESTESMECEEHQGSQRPKSPHRVTFVEQPTVLTSPTVQKPDSMLTPREFAALADQQLKRLGASKPKEEESAPVGDLDAGFHRMSLESSPESKSVRFTEPVNVEILSDAIESARRRVPVSLEGVGRPEVSVTPASSESGSREATPPVPQESSPPAKPTPRTSPRKATPISTTTVTGPSTSGAGGDRFSPITAEEDEYLDGDPRWVKIPRDENPDDSPKPGVPGAKDSV